MSERLRILAIDTAGNFGVLEQKIAEHLGTLQTSLVEELKKS